MFHLCVGHRHGHDKAGKEKEDLSEPQSLRTQAQAFLCPVFVAGLGCGLVLAWVPSPQAEVVEVTHIWALLLSS